MSLVRLAHTRRLATARLRTLKRAAALGGVSLALLAPPASGATAPTPEASGGDDDRRRDARSGERPRTSRTLDRPVRAATPEAQAVLDAVQRQAPAPAFAAAQTNPFGLTDVGSYSSASVADLDSDGDFDVLAGGGDGSFRYFENTAGAGNTPAFAAAQTNPFGLTNEGPDSKPSVADLDGDGDLDVLAGVGNGSFTYFENTAGAGNTPAFAAAQTNPFGLLGLAYRSVPSVADLDGDGDMDVLAGETNGNFVYFENTAGAGNTPTFAAAQTNPFGLTDVGYYSAPGVADLDGDGDLDVLAGEYDGNLFYFENTTGAGNTPTFAAAQTDPFGLADVGRYSALSVADLDGDGDLDVLAGEYDGSFFYFENTVVTPPAFAAAQTNPFGLTRLTVESKLSVADLDGDGDLDVLAGDRTGDFFYFENTAGAGNTPTFAAAQTNPFGLTDVGFYSTPAMADLDGDGDMDVLAGESRGDFVYFQNTAGAGNTPAFAAAQTNPFGLREIEFYSSPSVADLDGDGDLDVLAGQEEYGSFSYFENTAGPGNTPTFTLPQTNPFGLTDVGDQSAPAVADLDGDGDMDVLAGDNTGNFSYFENTAGAGNTPALASPQANPFGLTDVGGYSVPSIADLDGDGDLDVLSGESGGNFVYFENTADPISNTLTASVTGTDGWRMLAAPASGATLDDLLGGVHTQGFPGATSTDGTSNVLFYDESASGNETEGYTAPSNQSDAIGAGRGVFAYLYADDDFSTPGVQGGFPKPLAVTGATPLNTFGWGAAGSGALSYTDDPVAPPEDDGWNLLGNPFSSWMDWDAVDLANVNAPVYVYDAGTSAYR
ncbi:MAG: FG-GAP-like repeat-containing protein, partial [Bacteroidota bacterium]